MTAPTDQFVEAAKRSQDLFAETMKSWTETMQGLTGQVVGGGRPQMPDAAAAVDQMFDFAVQVLAQQRDLVKSVVGASSQAVDTWTDQAAKATEAVTEHAVHNAERATESVQKATRDAAEKTAGAARNNARSAK